MSLTFHRLAVVSCIIFTAALAQGAIVISDGPSSSSSAASPSKASSSASAKIVTTNGPAVMAYQYPPKIIISNGPAKLFYETSPKSTPVSVLPDPETATLAPAVPIMSSSLKKKDPVVKISRPVSQEVDLIPSENTQDFFTRFGLLFHDTYERIRDLFLRFI